MQNQNALIIAHLRKGKTITSLQAWDQFGVSALHSRVSDLRNVLGLTVKDEWIKVRTRNGTTRVKRYWIEEDG